jgi:RimJ/RimL family protein N-acetyltransferase
VLPWHGHDRQGTPIVLRLAERRDAIAWIEHLRRITSETAFMLQSEEDPLPTPAEQRSLLEEYQGRVGSVAILAARPGESPGKQEILGSVTLASGRSRRTEHLAELSMGVGKAWWGRGIGDLLMRAVLTYARDTPTLRRVSLLVFADNTGARHLYENYGFAIEGVLRRYVRWDGGTADLVAMALDTEVLRGTPWFGPREGSRGADA